MVSIHSQTRVMLEKGMAEPRFALVVRRLGSPVAFKDSHIEFLFGQRFINNKIKLRKAINDASNMFSGRVGNKFFEVFGFHSFTKEEMALPIAYYGSCRRLDIDLAIDKLVKLLKDSKISSNQSSERLAATKEFELAVDAEVEKLLVLESGSLISETIVFQVKVFLWNYLGFKSVSKAQIKRNVLFHDTTLRDMLQSIIARWMPPKIRKKIVKKLILMGYPAEWFQITGGAADDLSNRSDLTDIPFMPGLHSYQFAQELDKYIVSQLEKAGFGDLLSEFDLLRRRIPKQQPLKIAEKPPSKEEVRELLLKFPKIKEGGDLWNQLLWASTLKLTALYRGDCALTLQPLPVWALRPQAENMVQRMGLNSGQVFDTNNILSSMLRGAQAFTDAGGGVIFSPHINSQSKIGVPRELDLVEKLLAASEAEAIIFKNASANLGLQPDYVPRCTSPTEDILAEKKLNMPVGPHSHNICGRLPKVYLLHVLAGSTDQVCTWDVCVQPDPKRVKGYSNAQPDALSLFRVAAAAGWLNWNEHSRFQQQYAEVVDIISDFCEEVQNDNYYFMDYSIELRKRAAEVGAAPGWLTTSVPKLSLLIQRNTRSSDLELFFNIKKNMLTPLGLKIREKLMFLVLDLIKDTSRRLDHPMHVTPWMDQTGTLGRSDIERRLKAGYIMLDTSSGDIVPGPLSIQRDRIDQRLKSWWRELDSFLNASGVVSKMLNNIDDILADIDPMVRENLNFRSENGLPIVKYKQDFSQVDVLQSSDARSHLIRYAQIEQMQLDRTKVERSLVFIAISEYLAPLAKWLPDDYQEILRSSIISSQLIDITGVRKALGVIEKARIVLNQEYADFDTIAVMTKYIDSMDEEVILDFDYDTLYPFFETSRPRLFRTLEDYRKALGPEVENLTDFEILMPIWYPKDQIGQRVVSFIKQLWSFAPETRWLQSVFKNYYGLDFSKPLPEIFSKITKADKKAGKKWLKELEDKRSIRRKEKNRAKRDRKKWTPVVTEKVVQDSVSSWVNDTPTGKATIVATL